MHMRKILAAASAASLLGFAATAGAAETIKVGLVAPFSGPFAQYGAQMYAGIQAYFHLNGDEVAGKKVEIIRRDTGGAGPEIARRLSQELVNRDQVDFLTGYGLTPEALASAPIAERSKTPLIIMNAATLSIVEKSQYIARVSLATAQGSGVIGHWAANEGIKTAVTLVADYGPGLDAEAAFKKTYTRGGGEIVETIRTPLNNPDFGPFMQRIRDIKPDAVFVFVPAGEQSIGFMKNYQSRGLAELGIKVIGPGDVTDDHVLPSMGDEALGVITAFHYSVAHKSPENEKFLKAYAEVNPNAGQANFMTVGGYDGMDAIFQVSKALNGDIDGDKAMEILKGMKIDSPRGPLLIDPETRDVVHTEYIRRVERVDGQLKNVEFARFPEVKGDGDVSGQPESM
ncbi:ABC transporter substrate-binding protein [Pusillimonas caeni]|uniref:ABC transporter substrate-binding protein n=1 Tax=Pusillimonas caeni TaxID=1348472 RepID=UPI000E599756|nr:ABC transporter substrate-binding protein [Pusillimonas caeni]TFL15204.1 ABC transporter substrate-binding protein [Pusillimonas caeni]